MDRWRALRSRLPRLDPLVTDGMLALVAAGLSLAQMQGYPSPQDRSTLNIAFVLLQTLPLAFRRRAPFTVFAIAALALGVQGNLELQGPLFASWR